MYDQNHNYMNLGTSKDIKINIHTLFNSVMLIYQYLQIQKRKPTLQYSLI